MTITIKTLTPVSHGAFSDGIDLGNIQLFRRIPMIYNGEIYEVPVISGNAIRGKLRRLLARELVDHFELREELGKKFDKFYIAIANGGNLDKDMDVSINTEKIRELRSDFPMLSVLGSALYKFMMPGMCNIGYAYPRCKELGNGDIALADIVTEIGQTRHIDKTVADPGEAKPMPYTVEAIVPGAELEFNIYFAPQSTPIEIACINHGLKLMQTIGGKNGAGFGFIEISGAESDERYAEWLAADDTKQKLIAIAEAL